MLNRHEIYHIANLLQEALAPCKSIYISIDLDFIDPAYAPGVQTPEPLGLLPSDLLDILNKIIDKRVRIVDLVEVTPLYDYSELTSALAAKLVVEIAGLIAIRKDIRVQKCGDDVW